jgi:rubrerythrin
MTEGVHVDAALDADPCGTGQHLLVQAIETHFSEEEASVKAYRLPASETPDPVVSTLMRLLAEDEQRHHRLFREIGKTLRDRLDLNAETPATIDSRISAGDSEWLRRVHALKRMRAAGGRACAGDGHGH